MNDLAQRIAAVIGSSPTLDLHHTLMDFVVTQNARYEAGKRLLSVLILELAEELERRSVSFVNPSDARRQHCTLLGIPEAATDLEIEIARAKRDSTLPAKIPAEKSLADWVAITNRRRQNVRQEFAARLKSILNGMSPEELAEKVGTAPQTVKWWLAGATIPQKTSATKLAGLFGVSAEWLRDGSGDQFGKQED